MGFFNVALRFEQEDTDTGVFYYRFIPVRITKMLARIDMFLIYPLNHIQKDLRKSFRYCFNII